MRKVDELDVVHPVEPHTLWAQIAEDDMLRVQKLHRHNDLSQKEACRVVGQLAIPVDELVEGAVLHKLGDQVQITLVLEAVVQRHDEGIAEP